MKLVNIACFQNFTQFQTILDKTIDYTLIICSTCAYLMKKHQNTPLNLPPRPQNNVESVRNENNKTTFIGGGMGRFVLCNNNELRR